MIDGERNPNSEHRAQAPKTKQTLAFETRKGLLHPRSLNNTVLCNHFEKFSIADMFEITPLLFRGFTDQSVKNDVIH